MNIKENLREITTHVRKTKGSGAALAFYVEYVQPIYEYFENFKKQDQENINIFSIFAGIKRLIKLYKL